MTASPTRPQPHPVVWTILYVPFGALGGFVSVALTFLATRHGLSISEGALLTGASLLSQWLKWLWAPAVDVTLSPKRWYWIATAASAIGLVAMASIPMSPATLGPLLAVIAAASLINSIVGMSVESMMAAVTPREDVGRVSGWFQAGNLGGAGLGGGFGLYLLRALPSPWMAGALLGASFLACGIALAWLPDVASHARDTRPAEAVRGVVRDLGAMVKTRGGRLAALLCFLPIGTGAAQGTLAQAAVAAHWGASAAEVEKVQGLLAGAVTAVGCFAGGWVCQRMRPQRAYALFGVVLAAIAAAMALAPATVNMYVAWNFVYAFGVGLAYAAFTAVVLEAIGAGSAATKYNIFASLSNFPIWWMGLLLGRVAGREGPGAALYAEAALGVAGVAAFALVARVAREPVVVAQPVEVSTLTAVPNASTTGKPSDHVANS